MRAEKKQKIVENFRICLPNQNALRDLADQFGISKATALNYLNVSANRCAPKAIEVQMEAINQYRGKLIKNKSLEWTLVVYDDDESLFYEVGK